MRQKAMRAGNEFNSDAQAYQDLLFTTNTENNEFYQLLDLAKKNSKQLGLEGISISALEGRIVSFLVKNHRCKKFVEIGTLTGYSALWIAQGMEKGELFTLEKDEKHAQFALEVFNDFETKFNSNVKIKLVLGDAVETLHSLSKFAPFDGIFIDGNKAAYVEYLNWAESNLKSGALILADNVYLSGSVWGKKEDSFSNKQIKVMNEFNQRLASSKNYESCIIPTNEGLFAARLK